MRQTKKSNFPVITAEFGTVAELAEVMEKSEKTARRSLNGSRPFQFKEKRRICDYLGRELGEVFGNV